MSDNAIIYAIVYLIATPIMWLSCPVYPNEKPVNEILAMYLFWPLYLVLALFRLVFIGLMSLWFLAKNAGNIFSNVWRISMAILLDK